MDRTLEPYYSDAKHPASYTGVEKIYRAINGKYSRKQIKEWLKGKEEYTLHKAIKRKFKRRKVIVPYVGYQADADTANMVLYKDSNDDYGYFLLVIDCFSRMVYTRALKSLTATEVSENLKDILSMVKFERVRSDQGKEFVSKITQNMFKEMGIKHFVTHNTEIKANYSERAIKTLKNKLTLYMTSENTHKWYDKLQEMTDSYNQTYHSSIKQTPASVTEKDNAKLWKILYPDVPLTFKPFSLEVGDNVRISILKKAFDREYDENWSREHFIISERFKSQGFPIYKLKDLMGEEISGTFYEQELQKIKPSEVYKVEKVLKKKGKKVLVKWLSWPKKFNSWIDYESIKHL